MANASPSWKKESRPLSTANLIAGLNGIIDLLVKIAGIVGILVGLLWLIWIGRLLVVSILY